MNSQNHGDGLSIEVDIVNNRIGLDGSWLSGRRRWEALAMATLLEAAESGLNVTVERLNIVLADSGQVSPLDRTGIRRLWTALEELFQQGGKAAEFRDRFRQGPRGKTTGPWAWLPSPGDAYSPQATRPTIAARQKRMVQFSLAADGSIRNSLKLLDKLAVCHAIWAGGSRSEAIAVFQSGEEWELASPELWVHRSLHLADACLMAGRYDEARDWLGKAQKVVDDNEICRHHRSYLSLLKTAIPTYSSASQANSDAVRRMAATIETQVGSGDDIHGLYRAWMYTVLSLGYLHDVVKGRSVDAHSRLALESTLSSIYLALHGGALDWVCTHIDNLFRGLCEIYVYAGDVPLLEVVQCYVVAQRWYEVIEPRDSYSSGKYWIAWLALEEPKVIAMVDSLLRENSWIGGRPESTEFVDAVLKRLVEVGDPWWCSRALVLAYRHSKSRKDKKSMAEVRSRLERHLHDFPMMLMRLKEWRVLDKVPELLSIVSHRHL